MPARSLLSGYTYTWIVRVVDFYLLVFLGISWFGLSQQTQLPPIYSIEVINEYPHDPQAFTQGLLYWANDTLYESTGLYGQSSVRRVALRTGEVKAQHNMDASFFGEGLTLLRERLYQVTWREKIGFIYDRSSLTELKTFTNEMEEGWGLATNGIILFGTDGSSTLYHINPRTMNVIKRLTVTYNGREVRYLNELELVNREVWANVWLTDCIVRLSPRTGSVIGWILLPELREALIEAGETDIDVLNGIAWDSDNERIFVTGKLWPKLYEIKLHRSTNQSHSDVDRLCMRMQFHSKATQLQQSL